MPASWGTMGWEGYTPPSKTAPNPFETVTNAKSTKVDTRLNDLFARWDELRGMGKNAVNAYATDVNNATPQMQAFAQSDIGAINDIARGQTAADLAGIRQRRAEAIGLSADQARRQLGGTLALNQLSQGGGGRALGSGSYIQKLALNKLADINAKQAADNADAERADYAYNQGLRLSTIGQRGNYLNAIAQRRLLPFQAATDEYGSGLSTLNSMLQSYLGNNFIGLRKLQGVDYAA